MSDSKEVDLEKSVEVPFTLALIAGGIAGTTVDVALYPIDTLRTRLQSPKGFWASGGFSGMYTGVVATALGASPGAALFFSAYETMKPVLKKMNGGEEKWWQASAASSCGEVAACLVRVPTSIVTQRMQVGQYASFGEAVSKIAASEGGLMTFYTGYWTTVAREIPFSFIQFPMYEGMKKFLRMAQGSDTTPAQGATCGSIAGAIASAVTTPLDVIKTRLMLGNPSHISGEAYVGTIQTAKLMVAEEGAMALFKGIGPRVGWITAGGYVFFGAYEKAQEVLWKTNAWGDKYAVEGGKF
tara:strand:- start:132 stop:1025 length:894 start_codon:yes stop_codon:yes gene_type:complete